MNYRLMLEECIYERLKQYGYSDEEMNNMHRSQIQRYTKYTQVRGVISLHVGLPKGSHNLTYEQLKESVKWLNIILPSKE